MTEQNDQFMYVVGRETPQLFTDPELAWEVYCDEFCRNIDVWRIRGGALEFLYNTSGPNSQSISDFYQNIVAPFRLKKLLEKVAETEQMLAAVPDQKRVNK